MKAIFSTTLVIALIFSAANASAQIGGLPTDAQYKGSGLWRNEGNTGTYEVAATIENDKITSVYLIPGDQNEKRLEMIFQPKGNGFFNVVVSGTVIGDGYCLEKATNVCHYQAEFNGTTYEESIYAEGSNLYRYGSKLSKDFGRIVWQERLTRSKK